MLKTTYEAASLGIPTKELLDAACTFLLNSESNQELVLVDNIASSNFGSSDLLFVNKEKTHLITARLHDGVSCERFIISSMSYYFWLKELMRVSDLFHGGKSGLDMYLFSRDFSAAILYLISNLNKGSRMCLFKYRILQVEDLDEPAIDFQRVAFQGFVQDEPLKEARWPEGALLTEDKEDPNPVEITSQELRVFNQLRERHLT